VVAIPPTSAPEHVRANRAALDLVLDPEALGMLDAAFSPPRRKRPLEMI
jgi:diketogulonate reductase-like aldo/keto reductase